MAPLLSPLLIAAALAPAAEWEPIEIVILKLVTIGFFVLLNGFFVACEFAIVKVRASQLDSLVERGTEGAKFARHVAAHLDAYLSATQLGITLASLALGWLGEPFLARMVEPLFALAGVTSAPVIHASSFALAFASITFLHIVLGELAPKSLAIRKAVQTTLWVSRPLGVFYTVFKPAIWLLNGAANFILRWFLRVDPVAETELAHSEEELRLILAESHQAQEVSALGKGDAAECARPSEPAPSATSPRRAATWCFSTSKIRSWKTCAWPRLRGTPDSPSAAASRRDARPHSHQGFARARRASRSPNLRGDQTRPAHRARDDAAADVCSIFFLSRHAHMALAVDEFGGATGIVTLDNVLEELVGEIQDEFDRERPEIQRLSKEEFIVRGQLSLHELRAQTDLEVESDEVS